MGSGTCSFSATAHLRVLWNLEQDARSTRPVYHYHNGTPAQLQTLCGLKVRRVFICEGVYSKGCPAQRQAASSGVSPCLAADASAPLSNIPAGPTVPREEGRGGVEVRATRQGSNETRRQEAGGRFCCPAGPTPLAQTQHTDEPLFTDKHAKRALRGHELQHGRTGPPRSLARTGFERGAHALATGANALLSRAQLCGGTCERSWLTLTGLMGSLSDKPQRLGA